MRSAADRVLGLSPEQVAREQFEQLGRGDTRELAIALVTSYEGISLIANTFSDPKLSATEARRLDRWVDTISHARQS